MNVQFKWTNLYYLTQNFTIPKYQHLQRSLAHSKRVSQPERGMTISISNGRVECADCENKIIVIWINYPKKTVTIQKIKKLIFWSLKKKKKLIVQSWERGVPIRIGKQSTARDIELGYDVMTNGMNEGVVNVGARLRIEEAEEAKAHNVSRWEVAPFNRKISTE